MNKAEATKSQTMTVGDVIEMLKQFDLDSPCFFAYNCGDYWRSTVCGTISDIEETPVKYSDYHNRFKVVDDLDDSEEVVVVLS